MSEFRSGLIKYKRIRHDLSELISLKDYCQRFHITQSGAMHRIHSQKIIAYKISGRWWVLPPK